MMWQKEGCNYMWFEYLFLIVLYSNSCLFFAINLIRNHIGHTWIIQFYYWWWNSFNCRITFYTKDLFYGRMEYLLNVNIKRCKILFYFSYHTNIITNIAIPYSSSNYLSTLYYKPRILSYSDVVWSLRYQSQLMIP